MIDREKYAGAAILRVGDIKNGQSVTIDWFKEISTKLRDNPIQPALKLHEFESHLVLNTTNLDTLIEKFGNDEEKWKGKKIRLVIVDTKTPEGQPTKGIRIE